jgi:hypothetical protein
MNLKYAIEHDVQMVVQLVASARPDKTYSINDLKNHTSERIVTLDGEEVDVSDIDDWPNKWPLHNTYTYKWENYSQDPKITNTAAQDKALVVVFRQFQNAIKYIKFQRERDRRQPTTFRFRWEHDIEVFGGNERVLAQAYLPTSNPLNSAWSGLIQVNDLWNWGLWGKDGAAFLIQVLIHELFHSLGYRHDTHDPGSTLYPFANGVIFFTLRDKVRLWAAYGRRMLPGWIVDNLAKRLINGYDFD